MDFLTQEHPRVSIFYLLPKIHKPGFPPKSRPIVSAQGSVLENISKYVDSLLQPHVLQITFYIKDTSDFIQKIEYCSNPEQSVLLSLDVVSLYTSIPHDEIRSTVLNLENDANVLPSMHFILDLVDILEEKHYFCFQEDPD